MVAEVLTPLYIFQAFAVVLFIWDGYAIYAYCILVLSVISISVSLWETMASNRKIRKMARYSCPV
jgi:cation-transporting ATPase 13A2